MNKKILIKTSIIVVLVFMAAMAAGTFAFAETGKSQKVALQDTESRVSINSATIKELSTLSGIGKLRAEAIVAYRTENGDFSNIDDLKKVEGIGKKTFEKIKGRIVLE